jgi:threonine synthase
MRRFHESNNVDTSQDFVKALFADPEINKTHRLAAVNSINWARILAQITYFFYSYFNLIKSPSFLPASTVRFVVPTGNFGDILAGFFAKRMGLPAEKLVIATNSNDILHRFWESGRYEKNPVHGKEAQGGIPEDGAKAHESGVKETLSPAMDILVSSNFERLLWFLAYDVYSTNSDAVIQRSRWRRGDYRDDQIHLQRTTVEELHPGSSLRHWYRSSTTLSRSFETTINTSHRTRYRTPC